MQLGKFSPVVAQAQKTPRRVCMVGSGGGDEIDSLCRAAECGLVKKCLLVGDFQHWERLSGTGIETEWIEASAEEACWLGARLTGEGAADVLIKGNVKSGEFLKAVLDRNANLRTDSILSHIAVLDVPALGYLVGITDGGLNIAPDVEEKKAILKNGVICMQGLGAARPHVALLAASENVSVSMPATTHAAHLTQWAAAACPDALVEGPLAFDLAVSRDALRRKGIESRLQGRADVWLTPNIECGNMVAKCLISFSAALMAGVVMGAKVPLVLTSRADQPASKLVSLAVANQLVRNGQEVSE